jgi:spermidine/putrescine transport system substrate-binding protein
VMEKFQQETGHEVNIVPLSSSVARDRNIIKAIGDVDLVMVGSSTHKFLKKINKLKSFADISFENTKHIDPQWQAYCGEHGIPYSWGTSGIAYRRSVATDKVNSLQHFFHPEPAFKGRIVYSLEELMPLNMALLAVHAPNLTSNTEELEKAAMLLKGFSTNVLSYEHGLTYANRKGVDSQMAMTLLYSSDFGGIQRATKQDDWVYVVPQDGVLLWVDCLAIPAYRPINPAVVEFLDFINRPEIAALNAEQSQFSTPNVSALKFVSESYRNMPHFDSDSIKDASSFIELDREAFTRWRAVLRKTLESSEVTN